MGFRVFPAFAVGSLQCPTPKCPCSVQSPSVLSVLQCLTPTHRNKATAFCSAQWQSLPVANSNRTVFLQRPTAEYSCLQCPTPPVLLQCPWQRIAAVPKPHTFLQRSVAKSPRGAQPLQCRTPKLLTFADLATYNARLLCAKHAHLQQDQGVIVHTTLCNVMSFAPILPETLHFLRNKGFRVRMLEVNNFRA